jgi:predicted chitinase
MTSLQHQRPRPRPPHLRNTTASAGAGAANSEILEGVQASTGAQGASDAEAGAEKDQRPLDVAVEAVIATLPPAMVPAARDSVPGIIQQLISSDVRNVKQAAYILATAQHESGFGREQFSWSEPLVEDHNQFRAPADPKAKNARWRSTVHTTGSSVSGTSEADLQKKYWDNAYGGKLGNEKGTSDAANYRGRGFVQLTGRTHYENFSKALTEEGFTYELDGVVWGTAENPIDLAAHPDHVNRNRELAARIMIDGMMEGSFTGSALPEHVNDTDTDYYDARSVVNGDKAKNGRSIAGIAETYERALAPMWGNLVHPEWALPVSPTGERRGPV